MAPGQANKRVKGVSIFRPFVFGSVAKPIDPNKRPPNLPPEHTHQWTVFVKGVDNEDISYWLKKVQFKLHETYANPLRTIENAPFEVTETGWGEFEIQIKLYFVPESSEKPQTLWHPLKLHPFGPDAATIREKGLPVISQNYEEVVFNEPVEPFFDLLTGGGNPAETHGKRAGGKFGGKGAAAKHGNPHRTAEVPQRKSLANPYSAEQEGEELDRLKIAIKKVDEMIKSEREKMAEREEKLKELKETEDSITKK